MKHLWYNVQYRLGAALRRRGEAMQANALRRWAQGLPVNPVPTPKDNSAP